MGRFVGFRLRAKGKDKDIEDDLKRFTDESERVREAYRLAMAVERGEYVKVSALGAVPAAPMVPVTPPPKREPGKPISWEAFPKEPTVKPTPKPSEPGSKDDLKKNMLGGF